MYAASGPERDAAAVPDYVRFLAAGINVVTTTSTRLVLPPVYDGAARDRLAQAAAEGGASLYASGIFPGFASDQLALVAATLSSTVRKVRATEISLNNHYPVASVMMDGMGFGRPLDFQPQLGQPGFIPPSGEARSRSSPPGCRSNSTTSSAASIDMAYVNDDLPFGLPNGIGPEVTAMKKAGVDFVISCWELNGAKTVEQELERQGMGDVQLNSNQYDAAFVADADGLFDGAILRVPFRPFESASEGALATYKKWMKETDAKLTEVSMYGWINADLAYQGLKAVGPDLDRAKVIAD